MEVVHMFRNLFFISPFVLFLLGIIFPLCITHIEKIPNAVTINIGKLNGEDIRNFNKKERDYLRNQLLYHFIMAIATTFSISLAFVIFGNTDNAILVLPCNFIELIVGLVIILSVIRKTNKLKK